MKRTKKFEKNSKSIQIVLKTLTLNQEMKNRILIFLNLGNQHEYNKQIPFLTNKKAYFFESLYLNYNDSSNEFLNLEIFSINGNDQTRISKIIFKNENLKNETLNLFFDEKNVKGCLEIEILTNFKEKSLNRNRSDSQILFNYEEKNIFNKKIRKISYDQELSIIHNEKFCVEILNYQRKVLNEKINEMSLEIENNLLNTLRILEDDNIKMKHINNQIIVFFLFII